ncbi:MAG: aminopeptidase P family protein [Tissierellia bacterium]|nr:aminopeptidase P family protein [Tissierellia bacterium]
MRVLHELQGKMKEENIDFYIVPTGDPHGSEYTPSTYKDREWLTGFTGSAGTALITLEEGFVWIDGRYYIQGEKQLKGSGFQMKKAGLPETETLEEAILRLAKPQDTIGFNGKLLMESQLKSLKKSLNKRKVFYKDKDLISPLWKDRPGLSKEGLFLLELQYTKYSASEKIKQVQDILWEKNLDGTVISSLDDIAWTCNLRGKDIPENPVFYSFMVITKREATLYLPVEKQEREILDYLRDQNIYVRDYDQMYLDGKNTRGSRLYLDPQKTSATLYKNLEEGNEIHEGINITTNLKGIKNELEIENQKKAYITDGIALVKYFHWLKNHGIGTKEFDAQIQLTNFRKESNLYIEDSFTPISAYGSNGAMMHYSADANDSTRIEPKGFYLIDSGGHYFTGTTDITRTLAMGPLTEEEIRDYTLTLKSHIALATTVFLENTTGNELDAIARRPLWKYMMDYKCGTGHGVGYVLNVHEGPHNISRNKINVPLKPGMVVTIEPGVYKEDKYGIRLENVYVVKEVGESSDGKFYGFEVLSYVPLEPMAIDPSLLTSDELDWLNEYHKITYLSLKDYINEETKDWLKEVTKPIGD